MSDKNFSYSDYSILMSVRGPHDCSIYALPENMPAPIMPTQGDAMGSLYPDDMEFEMAIEVPGFQIPDVINNSLGYLMVSNRFKLLLEQQSGVNIEFLRFALLNHRKQVACDQCYIANILGTVDCVDKKKTLAVEHPLMDNQIREINILHLDISKIDEDRALFRIASRPRVIIIRSDLRLVCETNRITGLEFVNLGEEVRL